MLHSFYRMPAILYVAGVPTRVTLRWYKAPAGAKQLPFPSTIFSHVWDNNPGESQPGEIGEVGYPRTWDPGDNHGYQGQCYRGDPAWFQTGQLPALPLPASPCGCQIPPAQAAGGFVLAGSAVGVAALTTCTQCPAGAPVRWSLNLSGATGAWAALNGTWTLAYVSGCNWQFTIAAGKVVQLQFFAGAWQVRMQNSGQPGSPSFLRLASAFNCFGASSYTNQGGSADPAAPQLGQATPAA